MVRKPKRVALYVRVSTDGQTVDNQRRELEAVAERHGWDIVEVFEDRGVSGARSRSERPAMKRMMEGIARRQFDMVAAWSVDRLGRSLIDLIGFLKEMHAKGIDLYLDRQGIDTTTAAGKAMFQMMGVFAEFERAIIVERVKAGLARAKAEQRAGKERIGRDGTKKRAIGRLRLKPAVVAAVWRLREADGLSIEKIVAAQKIGVGSVSRILKASRPAQVS
jgi:DNA invertase Pin-like site-specific DNA recombinase